MHPNSPMQESTQQICIAVQEVMKCFMPSSDFRGNVVSQLETNHKAVLSTSILERDATDL